MKMKIDFKVNSFICAKPGHPKKSIETEGKSQENANQPWQKSFSHHSSIIHYCDLSCS
jgi:hypothetical protein